MTPFRPMNRAIASTVARNRHLTGLVFGALLGQIVALMAAREDASMMGFGMSTVFIAASSASFVLFVLGVQGPQQQKQRDALVRQAQGLVAVIGVGLLVSLGLPG